jgi:uncharacterized protein
VIFVDTGAFVARYIRRDDHHRLSKRSSYSFAADRARSLPSSAALTVLRPDADDESQAVELFAKFADQRVSFTDCVSFVLMRRHRLESAFSFDRHFTDAGFEVVP